MAWIRRHLDHLDDMYEQLSEKRQYEALQAESKRWTVLKPAGQEII